MKVKGLKQNELLPSPLSTVRTNVCLIFAGMEAPSSTSWPRGAEDFVRKIHKAGIDITIVGPRTKQRIGPKSQIKHFDRHDVVTLKKLARAKEQSIELRLIGKKLKAWTRIRSDVCVVSGNLGVWPEPFPGWASRGVMSIDALVRWVKEYGWLPGRKFIFLGSTNRVVTWATYLLERGAASCIVVETSSDERCWRSHKDRFLSLGGRLLVNHRVSRLQEQGQGGDLAVFLRNSDGTLILDADTVVMSPINQEAINAPNQWGQGLFYIQRQYSELDPVIDEGPHLSMMDWQEIYWRVMRRLERVAHGEATGSIQRIREERKLSRLYMKKRNEITYKGKNLTREAMEFVRSTGSSPQNFLHNKPMASLECFERIPCTACADACPHEAIEKKSLVDFVHLKADACVGCGLCVAVCPSGAAVMVKETSQSHMAHYYLASNEKEQWKPGDTLQLLNRKGDSLASGKVLNVTTYQGGLRPVLEIESPSYNIWDARAVRRPPNPKHALEDPAVVGELNKDQQKKGWITLNGAKRISPIDVPITVALWKMGYRRFEDALFCKDQSCRLCEVTVNGKPQLACKAVMEESSTVQFESKKIESAAPCFCKDISQDTLNELQSQGASSSFAKQCLDWGRGTCKGRWCMARATDEESRRPCWPGYEVSPWIELWLADIL
jgi:Pyruvate/2-oxoacid:ferredoxin oxidoreductase delta subunit